MAAAGGSEWGVEANSARPNVLRVLWGAGKETQVSDKMGTLRYLDVHILWTSEALRQALLEIYVAVALDAPYNDFETDQGDGSQAAGLL